MKFENLLNYLDTGVCVEQVQQEALIDLVVLFTKIDDALDDSEFISVKKYLNKLSCESKIYNEVYIHDIKLKCSDIIKDKQINEFIFQRAQNIHDETIKEQTVKLIKSTLLTEHLISPLKKQSFEFLQTCFDKEVA
ncbi:hypothetical protein [Pseudoalteromonas denitrificans]|uniref:Tellurite resistance protein TerB n=1 Tax=Pseudoalteromonas denitrificans DSM 6059 TaxID=1123010 RepID=A0A1I1KJQ9_9GAMM|nr:hypothetical protein [Pseudoalteromonas denitrificans]SFC61096.1 hypothetical protein SAMN02745724_02095 [Pseudoalteromonas denitrificans DSM 6059]